MNELTWWEVIQPDTGY